MPSLTLPLRLAGACALLAATLGCASAPTRPLLREPTAAIATPGNTANPSGPTPPPSASASVVRGTVTYEARHPTASGASRALELRPARYVRVQALGAGDAVLGEVWADALGRFELPLPPGTTAVLALAHARADGHDVSVCGDRSGTRVHGVRAPLGAPGTSLSLAATDAAEGGPAGAFHITDTILRGLEATRRWTGRSLPPLWVYWGRGVTTNWSFYLGERPARSGRFALELLGGERGRQDSTDTDEHDEAIMLHELGHFVMDRLSSSSSAGGQHPSGTYLDPGLAWEEGRATWFATAVLGAPYYQDTIGLEPGGRLRVDHDLEAGARAAPGPRGIGSEATVADLLWDLSDGVEGQPDTDHDGVALGPAAVLQTMIQLGEQPGAYPCLGTFLRALVTQQRLPAEALTAMLTATGEPVSALPLDDVSPWPLDLPVPGRVTGKVDGLTQPAPHGGPARPLNGYDALMVYRIHLTQRARLLAEVRIAGSGRPAEHLDVDLELRDLRADMITSSRGETDREVILRTLDPGWYLLYVRDGGQGNRASFDLDVRATPVGPAPSPSPPSPPSPPPAPTVAP